MSAGPTARPIFQVHPLQRCNLKCLHCYSDSSPVSRATLPLTTVQRAIRSAADWGYGVLAVSGGEPLLYPNLKQLLDCARACEMRTAVVTNGLLLSRPGALRALERVDAVAVSVDGLSDSHDRLRGRVRAFDKVLAALELLRREGIPFSVSCGVTPRNLPELDELAVAVHAAGAGALQLHPVEASGRAAGPSEELVLDNELSTLFYVFASILRARFDGRLAVHVDAIHRTTAVEHPRYVYAHPRPSPAARLAESVGVLVLDFFGTLMPVSYGFGSSYWLGNVNEPDLNGVARRYLEGEAGASRLYALGQSVMTRIAHGDGPDVFNPSDVLARASHEQGIDLALR